MMAPSTSSRLAYIDWMRGLACVVMFQTHCYDAWLGGSARKSNFFMYSQLGGTLPAPLFLFLAGISLALVTNKLRQKGLQPSQIARTTIRRGAEILGLGFLFRLQEFVIAWGWAPWSDLLRVDVLNIIGVSMMLMGACAGLFCRLRGVQEQSIWSCRLHWPQPQPVLLWPSRYSRRFFGPPGGRAGCPGHWSLTSTACTISASRRRGYFRFSPGRAFAFAGLAVGFLLLRDGHVSARRRRSCWQGAAGVGLIYLSRWLDARPVQLYPVYDYWHTSPEFFLLRVGLLLIVLCAAYAWCRWGAGQWGFSPLIQLGKTSLLVYWVHIEFVYGRFSILPKRALDIRAASLGLLTIFLAMLLLSWLRTRLKGCGAEALAWLRPPARVG